MPAAAACVRVVAQELKRHNDRLDRRFVDGNNVYLIKYNHCIEDLT